MKAFCGINVPFLSDAPGTAPNAACRGSSGCRLSCCFGCSFHTDSGRLHEDMRCSLFPARPASCSALQSEPSPNSELLPTLDILASWDLWSPLAFTSRGHRGLMPFQGGIGRQNFQWPAPGAKLSLSCFSPLWCLYIFNSLSKKSRRYQRREDLSCNKVSSKG